MYVGTILKKDNSVEIKTIKIELIKKNFDDGTRIFRYIPYKWQRINAPQIRKPATIS